MLVINTNKNTCAYIVLFIILFFLEYVILSCYEIYRQILTKTLQNLDKDAKFLMKILININTCVDKNIFADKQLWQIISGRFLITSMY